MGKYKSLGMRMNIFSSIDLESRFKHLEIGYCAIPLIGSERHEHIMIGSGLSTNKM